MQEGPVAYIAACGWSRQVWLWSDLPADTEGRARVPCLRCFHGHEDDVLCASFAAPNVLATGCYDGQILVWNLDSGALKGKLATSSASRDDDALAELPSRSAAAARC